MNIRREIQAIKARLDNIEAFLFVGDRLDPR